MQDARDVKSFEGLVCILLQDKCKSILFKTSSKHSRMQDARGVKSFGAWCAFYYKTSVNLFYSKTSSKHGLKLNTKRESD